MVSASAMNRPALVIFGAAAFVACSAPSSPEASVEESRLESVCTPANKAELLAQMLTQPIQPPRFAAGLDLAGDAAWSGLLQSTVETAYCAGIADGSDDQLSYFIWGSDGNTYPVEAGFDASHKLGFIALNQPYTGGIDFKSRPGGAFGDHTYAMRLGTPILRDGQPFVLDWNDSAHLAVTATELSDALVFTFAPELPPVASDCVASHRCFVDITSETKEDDGGGVIGARDVSFYVHVPTAQITAHPGPSAPDYFYIFPKAAHLSGG
jgi:hypothetical protein